MIQQIIECLIAIGAVIFYLWAGIFIGRKFGTFENFVLAVLEELKKKEGE